MVGLEGELLAVDLRWVSAAFLEARRREKRGMAALMSRRSERMFVMKYVMRGDYDSRDECALLLSTDVDSRSVGESDPWCGIATMLCIEPTVNSRVLVYERSKNLLHCWLLLVYLSHDPELAFIG